MGLPNTSGSRWVALADRGSDRTTHGSARPLKATLPEDDCMAEFRLELCLTDRNHELPSRRACGLGRKSVRAGEDLVTGEEAFMKLKKALALLAAMLLALPPLQAAATSFATSQISIESSVTYTAGKKKKKKAKAKTKSRGQSRPAAATKRGM